jgi:hypothetical protein
MPKRADRRRREKNGDAPPLAHIVSRLSPEVLHHLVRDHGLDACGALIAASTPQQVASLLDLDLWHATPGADDQFDERRFGAWIEMLMDGGEASAARVVAAIDRSLAIAGLSRYVRVFDPGALPSVPSIDDDLDGLEVTPSVSLECEVGGYLVRARTAHAWDAIVGLLVTLADAQPDAFAALMQGCRRLSDSTPEADGFHALMLEPDQLRHDVSVDREHRRSQQGYLTAGDARAFLQMARQPRRPAPHGASPVNAIAAAYFRSLDDARPAGHKERRRGVPVERQEQESMDAVVDLLAEAGVAFARPRALLASGKGAPSLGPEPGDAAGVALLQPLMEHVHGTNEGASFARSRELAFLANALLAGCSVQGRPFTVEEARDAAVGICNLGLEVWPARWPATGLDAAQVATPAAALPDAFLTDHDLVTAFEAGWSLLHEDVSMFVAERLIATLADLRTIDAASQRDLHVLRRELERNRQAGTPWKAREALDPIAILDLPTWACVAGLLSECPVLPAALTAILGGHARSVSADAFVCFTTRGQIRQVHQFGDRIRDLLH